MILREHFPNAGKDRAKTEFRFILFGSVISSKGGCRCSYFPSAVSGPSESPQESRSLCTVLFESSECRNATGPPGKRPESDSQRVKSFSHAIFSTPSQLSSALDLRFGYSSSLETKFGRIAGNAMDRPRPRAIRLEEGPEGPSAVAIGRWPHERKGPLCGLGSGPGGFDL